MFTGIIEEIGTVRGIRDVSKGALLTICAKAVVSGLRAGDSIAVNGVCLTVTRAGHDEFACDLSSETVQGTTLGGLDIDAQVNLERPLSIGARLGGHFVQGHADGVGRLRSRSGGRGAHDLVFEYPSELERYIVRKGSIAVDGISLTIAAIREMTFSVAVIPFTLKMTNLGRMKPGTAVNIEVDILGKYIERFLQARLGKEPAPRLTEEYLRQQGF